jgi:hypothetical protein
VHLDCWCELQAAGAVSGLAAYGFFRHQFVVWPGRVHVLALALLRKDPAVREVLQLPLTPEQPVASVVSGGFVQFKVCVESGNADIGVLLA